MLGAVGIERPGVTGGQGEGRFDVLIDDGCSAGLLVRRLSIGQLQSGRRIFVCLRHLGGEGRWAAGWRPASPCRDPKRRLMGAMEVCVLGEDDCISHSEGTVARGERRLATLYR